MFYKGIPPMAKKRRKSMNTTHNSPNGEGGAQEKRTRLPRQRTNRTAMRTNYNEFLTRLKIVPHLRTNWQKIANFAMRYFITRF